MNNWKFGKNNIKDITQKLLNSKLDIIECGLFISTINENENNTIFNHINSIEKLLIE